jgi:hypothetical protein
LVPADADPERTFRVLMQLAPYEGEVVEKAVVKDKIAECLDTYVCKIAWPMGWRRVDLM